MAAGRWRLLVGKVSDDGEEGGGCEGSVGRRCGEIRPGKGFGLQGAAVGRDGEGKDGGEQKDEKRVEVEGFAEMAVEQGGECASGAAAGALDAEELVDGTARIEGVLRPADNAPARRRGEPTL